MPKDQLEKLVLSFFWAVGVAERDGEPTILDLKSGSNSLYGSISTKDGQYVTGVIGCTTDEPGAMRIEFNHLRGVLGATIGNIMDFRVQSSKIAVIHSEGCQAGLQLRAPGAEEHPPETFELEWLSGTVNKISMHQAALAGDDKRLTFYSNEMNGFLWGETEGQDGTCLFKIKNLKGGSPTLTPQPISVDANKFCYFMRAMTNFGFGKVSATIAQGALWVKSPCFSFALPFKQETGSLRMVKTPIKVAEQSRVVELKCSRTALVKSLEACLFAKPNMNTIELSSIESKGQPYMLVRGKGVYDMRKIVSIDNKFDGVYQTNGDQLLSFLKTSMDAIMTIKMGTTGLFIDQADNTRFYQWIKAKAS